MSPNCRVPFNNGLRCKCFAIHWVSTFDGLPKLLKRSKVCFFVCVCDHTCRCSERTGCRCSACTIRSETSDTLWQQSHCSQKGPCVWVVPCSTSMLGMLKKKKKSIELLFLLLILLSCFHFNHFLNIVQNGLAPIIACSSQLRLECIFFVPV